MTSPPQASYPTAPSPFNINSLQSNFPSPFSQPNLNSSFAQADPNSPEVFKQNIHIVQEQVERISSLARGVLGGIEHAYHSGNSPSQTEADINTLKQALQMLSEFMRQSGVGALPLIPLPTDSGQSPVITEETMLADTTRNVGVLYERMKRTQDSAAVVVSLMSSVEGSGPRTLAGR